MTPKWLSKLQANYDRRHTLAQDNVMYMAPSNVPSLMILASETLLKYQHHYTSDRIADVISPDLKEFLWPLAGIESVEEKMEECNLKIPNPSARADYKTPFAYYSHMIYLRIQKEFYGDDKEVKTLEDVIHCLVNAVLICQELGFDYCFYGTEPISHALEAPFRINHITKAYETKKRFVLPVLNKK